MRKVAQTMDLLAVVGQRVRAAREVRGESRAALAERAGLSTRFLAQLEAGTGNISILRLRDVAEALGVECTALLTKEVAPIAPPRVATNRRAAGHATSADAQAAAALSDEIGTYLSGRNVDELREVRDELAARFAPPGGPLVALLGLRGAGKSSVGRQLARSLRVDFFELDTLIEEKAGMQLAQLFELQGPTRYRQLERDTLRRFLATTRAGVLATGGGIVTEPETFTLLRQRCVTVWLRARPEEHWGRVVRQGDRRPMRGNPDAMHELRALLAAREPLYAQADLTLATSDSTATRVGRELARLIRARDPRNIAAAPGALGASTSKPRVKRTGRRGARV